MKRCDARPCMPLWPACCGGETAYGGALDAAALRPHVTLARKVSPAPVLPPLRAFDWSVSEFSLMLSNTRGAHSAYTVIATWPLLYEGKK